VATADWINAVTPIVAVLITLVAGWLIGQRVTDRWEHTRKRRELDMSALAELYRCYGEFNAVWKAWNRYCHLTNRSVAPRTPAGICFCVLLQPRAALRRY
jgi:hypothetical protein